MTQLGPEWEQTQVPLVRTGLETGDEAVRRREWVEQFLLSLGSAVTWHRRRKLFLDFIWPGVPLRALSREG